MEKSLLHSLIKSILSRYYGDVDVPYSPQLITFFHANNMLSSILYDVFSKDVGNYNEITLHKYKTIKSAGVPIMECGANEIRV